MNLSLIYGYLDNTDRKIIIRAMKLYKVSGTRGIKIKDWKLPEHNTIWVLNAFVVRTALCHDLNSYNSFEYKGDGYISFRIKKLNRMVRLIDDIL